MSTLYLDMDGTIATNTPGEPVVWSRAKLPGLHLLRVGSQKQPMLEKWGDNLRIDWGYFYVAVPDGQGDSSLAAGNQRRSRSLCRYRRTCRRQDDLDQPRMPQSRYPSPPMLNLAIPLAKVDASPVTRHVLLAYDDIYSIEYMHQKLLPYWRTQFSELSRRCFRPQSTIIPRWRRARSGTTPNCSTTWCRPGARNTRPSPRWRSAQAIAAHKLVEDANGVPFFMPKENFSNGSISTVDVLYPSSPMFLFLNPKLVEAQLEPVARYAETEPLEIPLCPA